MLIFGQILTKFYNQTDAYTDMCLITGRVSNVVEFLGVGLVRLRTFNSELNGAT